eukprot:14270674-Alexandrium_andersonii.AAC.1
MARLEALQLIGAEGAVVQVDHLPESGSLRAAQPAGGERQGNLKGRWAPRASLGEREGSDWVCVRMPSRARSTPEGTPMAES